MESFQPGNPKDGVSRKLKIVVLSLSVVICLVFFLLIGKLAETMFFDSPSPEASHWKSQLLEVGNKLQNAGLPEQAIGQYIKYLDQPGIVPRSRAKVSRAVGKLYIQLGNCREALVWLYRSEATQPAKTREAGLNKEIDFCLHQVQPRASR